MVSGRLVRNATFCHASWPSAGCDGESLTHKLKPGEQSLRCMPSIFSHAIFASAVGRAFVNNDNLPLRFWLLTAGCAMLPDVDAVSFLFGVPYGNIFGHRGITHSIAFAVLTRG